MLGWNELKETIEVTEGTVECPVRDCEEKVPRQSRVFRREERFKCPRHHIYISPSTFEYEDELDNLLWKEEGDLELFRGVKGVKRESRMARDNSEDAVTWNVFRFLQKSGLLPGFLSQLADVSCRGCETLYWPYSQREGGVWSPLQQAREEFETRPGKGSEPDVIIPCDHNLFFTEAKVTSGNNTVPHSPNPQVQRKYETGGNRWYQKVFRSDWKTVAVAHQKYELLRFWLIGTWIAHNLNLDFHLVNLVLSEREKNIEEAFKPHIQENQHRKFYRATWETIYHHIVNSHLTTPDKHLITTYFQEKTLGYDAHGKLQKAFSTPQNHQ